MTMNPTSSKATATTANTSQTLALSVMGRAYTENDHV